MKAAVQAMAAAVGESNSGARSEPTSMRPKIDGPTLKQPKFDWSTVDRYTELKNFRLEVNNIFKRDSVKHTEILSIIKMCLGRQGLQFTETLTKEEYEICKTVEGLFNILNNKFCPQHKETIKSS